MEDPMPVNNGFKNFDRKVRGETNDDQHPIGETPETWGGEQSGAGDGSQGDYNLERYPDHLSGDLAFQPRPDRPMGMYGLDSRTRGPSFQSVRSDTPRERQADVRGDSGEDRERTTSSHVLLRYLGCVLHRCDDGKYLVILDTMGLTDEESRTRTEDVQAVLDEYCTGIQKISEATPAWLVRPTQN